MKELSRLNTFDELETWLEGLVCHHSYAGVLPGLTGAGPAELDFDDDLRASLEVVRDLRSVSAQLREAEVRHMHEIEASLHVRFSEELEYADPKARSFVLHRFPVYLSSLFVEVQKRSLLTVRESNIL